MNCLVAILIAAGFMAGIGRARAEEVISTTNCKVKGIRQKVTVEIVMTKGNFYEDTEGWCGEGKKWGGVFEIRVRTSRKLLSRTQLDGFSKFYAPKFKLVMHDYSGEGRTEFNLGRYGACMYNEYWIFTIHRDGSVSKLPCGDSEEGSLTVSGARHENSTRTIKATRGLMSSTVYDRGEDGGHAGYVTEQRAWKHGKFVLVKSAPSENSARTSHRATNRPGLQFIYYIDQP